MSWSEIVLLICLPLSLIAWGIASTVYFNLIEDLKTEKAGAKQAQEVSRANHNSAEQWRKEYLAQKERCMSYQCRADRLEQENARLNNALIAMLGSTEGDDE